VSIFGYSRTAEHTELQYQICHLKWMPQKCEVELRRSMNELIDEMEGQL